MKVGLIKTTHNAFYNEESVKNVNAFRTVVESNLKLYTDEGEHKKTVRYWVTNTEKAMPIELNIQAPESLSKRNIQKYPFSTRQ